VTCARCGRPECVGCAPPTGSLTRSALPWEDARGSWSERLWRTALATSTEPRLTFGQLPEGPLLPAFLFAIAAELLAIGSLALVATPLLWMVAPYLVGDLLRSPDIMTGAAGLVLLAILTMVGLHALWGLCLELGALTCGAGARFSLGLRFGLYACGWDLLTSPAGVVQGLAGRGLVGAWKPIASAARVPRSAMDAYLQQRRQLTPAARRRAVLFSLAILGGLGLLSVGGLATLLWWTSGAVL
jgi:hypothetical protein